MNDWITAFIPHPHNEPINDGKCISLDSNGRIEWETDKFLPIEGSFSSKVSIRSHRSSEAELLLRGFKYTHIVLSGNPVKFLQGHNVFGSDDLPGLLADCFKKVCFLINKPQLFSYSAIHNAYLTRVDINYGYSLPDTNAVNSWLRSAESSTNLKYRGKGQFDHGTLYFGRNSSYWFIKFYHKGNEIRANKKNQRIDLLDNNNVSAFADTLLRCEVQIKSRELKRVGLRSVSAWHDIDVQKLYNGYTSGLEFSENTMIITDEKIKKLPANYQNTYTAWIEGVDLRERFKRPTFYRHRRFLMNELNIDIGIKQPTNRADMTNVIPLVRYLEAVPASTPEWAYGTDWLYEPNHFPDSEKRSLKLSDFSIDKQA